MNRSFRRTKIFTVALAALFGVQSLCTVSFADTCGLSYASEEAGVICASSSDDTDQAVTYELSDYVNNEVLVLYSSGTVELRTYDSQEELEKGLEELAEDDSVSAFQPNFEYENESSDTLSMDRVMSSVSGTGGTDSSDTTVSVPTEAAEVTNANTSSSSTSGKNDHYFSSQWDLYNDGTFSGSSGTSAKAGIDVNAEEAWADYSAKRSTVIAIVDTGVDNTNAELSDRIWTNEDEIAGNGKDDDGNGYIDDVNGWDFYYNDNKIYYGSEDDHGTHCAGSMVAESDNSVGIAGLADYDNIKLMVVKALGGSDGAGTTLSVIQGIKYAEANGATVCNLSMGTQNSDQMLYQTIKNSDMLFVVAAGNSSSNQTNTDIYPSYPASYDLDNVISVANITSAGKLASTSCYGKYTVDLAAPGSEILSTLAKGKYGYMTGTSMAAPLVTAAAAMVYTNSTNISMANVKDILLDTTESLTALSGKCVTGGMLDVGAAVKYDTSGMTSRAWDNSSSTSTGQTARSGSTTVTTPSTPGNVVSTPSVPVNSPSNGGGYYSSRPSAGRGGSVFSIGFGFGNFDDTWNSLLDELFNYW